MRESKQRDVVYQVVMSSCDHPNAEMVLSRCKNIMSSINVATVYRNLNALSKEGKILRIQLPSGDRFDKTLNCHAHFTCDNCGKFFDVENLVLDNIQKSVYKDISEVKDVSINLSGICIDCKKNIN